MSKLLKRWSVYLALLVTLSLGLAQLPAVAAPATYGTTASQPAVVPNVIVTAINCASPTHSDEACPTAAASGTADPTTTAVASGTATPCTSALRSTPARAVATNTVVLTAEPSVSAIPTCDTGSPSPGPSTSATTGPSTTSTTGPSTTSTTGPSTTATTGPSTTVTTGPSTTVTTGPSTTSTTGPSTTATTEPSVSVTSEPSVSPSVTVTPEPSASWTGVASSTSTGTASASPTYTPTSTYTSTYTATPTYTSTYTPTPTATATPEDCPTTTLTPAAGAQEPKTEQGDDSYRVKNAKTNVCELTLTFKIGRYYGPTNANGKILPAQLGETIDQTGNLIIETAGAQGLITITFAGKTYPAEQAGNNRTIRLTVDNDQVKRLNLPANKGNGGFPPLASNDLVIKLEKKATTIKSATLLLAGMRPLITSAGFNLDQTLGCGNAWCKETTRTYWGWTWGAMGAMVEFPDRNGHANLLKGNDSLSNGGINIIEAVDKALTDYGLRDRNDANPNDNLKKAVGKVNILGHSMGGLWGRSALFQMQRGKDTPVDKMMLLGSPNEGSRWATVLANTGAADCTAARLLRRVEPWPAFIFGVETPPHIAWRLALVPLTAACNYYRAVQPALDNLTTNYMQNTFNPRLLGVETQLAHRAAGDGKPVTYVTLAGIAHARGIPPCYAITLPIGCPNDQIVSQASANGGNMRGLATNLPSVALPGWPNIPINLTASLLTWSLVMRDTLHQALPKENGPRGAPSLRDPADPRRRSIFMMRLLPSFWYMANNYELDAIRNAGNGGGGGLLADSGAAKSSLAKNSPAATTSGTTDDYYSYPTIRGSVSINQSYTHTISVDDGTQNAFFDLGWINETATLQFTLRDPAGRLVGANYPGATYLTGTTTVGFGIDNPLAGDWQVVATGAGGTLYEPYSLNIGLLGGLSVNPQVSTNSSRLGQPVTITTTLGSPINNAVVTATIYYPSANVDTTTLLLTAIGGGVYRAQYIPIIAGDYMVYVEAVGRNPQGHNFDRITTTMFQASSAATFSGSYSERAYDDDSDGLYNRLVLTSGLTVVNEGSYLLNGCLTKADGSTIACTGNKVTLAQGSQQVSLTFSGQEIAAALADGPYQLRDLSLSYLGGGGLGLAEQPLAYTTSSYSRYAWQRNNVILAAPARESALDDNNNGRYDQLQVAIPLDVRSAGSYNVSLNLVAPNGSVVVSSSAGGVQLAAGSSTLTVNFDGAAIGRSGVDGPYRIADLSIQNPASGSYLSSVLVATRPYLASDFESGPTCTASFSDVPAASIFYSDIRYLSCRTLISGYANPSGSYRFEPGTNATRGQFAKVATLSFGLPLHSTGNPTFGDVPYGSVFYPYVEAASGAGVISGYPDGLFRPNALVTRAQVAKIVTLARHYPLLNPTQARFQDVPVGSFAYPYVETLVSKGILSGAACGPASCFRPNDNIRRDELAKVVRRAVESTP